MAVAHSAPAWGVRGRACLGAQGQARGLVPRAYQGIPGREGQGGRQPSKSNLFPVIDFFSPSLNYEDATTHSFTLS